MKCPGQDSRFWKQDAIYETRCPECGQDVEFFKDDTSGKCTYCGHRFPNPQMDFGCAAYCQFAEQCLGTLPEEIKDKQQDLVKDKVGLEMRRYFQNNPKQIQHVNTVVRYAEQIGKEEGGDLGVIIMAAYLYDMQAREAEKSNDLTAPRPSNQHSTAMARQILEKLQVQEDIIKQVCAIVEQQPAEKENLNCKIVYDALLITRLQEKQQEGPQDIKDVLFRYKRKFRTKSGETLAKKILHNL